jgi:hypothetical protein
MGELLRSFTVNADYRVMESLSGFQTVPSISKT